MQNLCLLWIFFCCARNPCFAWL